MVRLWADWRSFSKNQDAVNVTFLSRGLKLLAWLDTRVCMALVHSALETSKKATGICAACSLAEAIY
jgi:hypothetical protein